jgi:outer membrane protein assembly factor BamB
MIPGQMWLLIPVAGTVSADVRGTSAGTSASGGAIVAMKIMDIGGSVSLEPGWTSRTIASPSAPLVINGVVFAVATGRPAAVNGRGTGAVVYGLDGTTGKELWNSGTAVAGHMPPRSFWAANSQIVVTDIGGTVYSFGYVMERR